jgi:serine/threonine-protein phosphatase 2A regulatory subunit B''
LADTIVMQEVLRRAAQFGYDIRVEVVKDEIFDMVRPKDPLHITLDDLLASGVGDMVVDILTDVNGFIRYDNRESQLAQTGSGDSQ